MLSIQPQSLTDAELIRYVEISEDEEIPRTWARELAKRLDALIAALNEEQQ